MRAGHRFAGGRFGTRRGRMASPFDPSKELPVLKPTKAQLRARLLERLDMADGVMVRVDDKIVDSKELLQAGKWASVQGAFFEEPPDTAAGHFNHGCALALALRFDDAQTALDASMSADAQWEAAVREAKMVIAGVAEEAT